MASTILVPFEHQEPEYHDELVLGRLPEFCPEAFQVQTVLQPQVGVDPKKIKQKPVNYNILTEP
jgi:hypothetical protein